MKPTALFRPLGLAALLLLGTAVAGAASPDVRILVDVSGSMKKNDPRNLRRPALGLVSELLPEGTRAGAWLFAADPSPLVPVGPVDTAWRELARQRLQQIHSRGLFTDIEEAIDAAIDGWEGEAEAGGRHIVLLTDGVVDVSRNTDLSEVSRARIVSDQIARLQGLGVKVHAIALSDKVDTALMKLLTDATGGWLEAADDAEALQRVFLHMLEQAAPPTTVPLEGNAFSIDDSISEMTLLAFRGDGEPARLVDPTGTVWTADSTDERLRWRAEGAYDLVTITAPAPGEWRLEGAEDPDNRVAVVTDLGIDIGPLPAGLPDGTAIDMVTWLTDHDTPVTREDLLRMVNASVRFTGASGETREMPLALIPESGRFTAQLSGDRLAEGSWDMQVLLDGGTFRRALQRKLRVLPPALRLQASGRDYLAATDTSGPIPAAVLLEVLTDERRLAPASVGGHIVIETPAGERHVLEVRPDNRSAEQVVLSAGEHQVTARLVYSDATGSLRQVTLQERVRINTGPPAVPEESTGPVDAAPTTRSPLRIAAIVGAGNVVFLPLLGLTWWLLGRRTRKAMKGVAA